MDQSTSSIISLFIIAAAFYFIMIRPQQKRQKEHQELIGSLAVGDRVVTVGGAYGTVATADESRLGIEVAPGVVIEFDRAAIARKLEGSAHDA